MRRWRWRSWFRRLWTARVVAPNGKADHGADFDIRAIKGAWLPLRPSRGECRQLAKCRWALSSHKTQDLVAGAGRTQEGIVYGFAELLFGIHGFPRHRPGYARRVAIFREIRECTMAPISSGCSVRIIGMGTQKASTEVRCSEFKVPHHQSECLLWMTVIAHTFTAARNRLDHRPPTAETAAYTWWPTWTARRSAILCDFERRREALVPRLCGDQFPVRRDLQV